MDLRTIAPLGGMEAVRATEPGPAPQFDWLPIAKLRVDPAYQRPITNQGRVNIAKIVAGFRWNRFAPIVVSPIVGGCFAIVDGQHRATAAATLGYEAVPCQIILADRTEQAAAFAAINGAVTRVNGQTLHKAAVAAGDPMARRLEAVAAAGGVKILPYPVRELDQEPGETMAIAELRSAIERHGDEVVAIALRALRAGQNDVRGGGGRQHRLCRHRHRRLDASQGRRRGADSRLRRLGAPHPRGGQGPRRGSTEGRLDQVGALRSPAHGARRVGARG